MREGKDADKIMIHLGMINRYNMEVRNIDFQSIEKSNVAILIGDPDKPLEQWEMAQMIRYFSSIEDYEKSAKLLKIYEVQFSTSNIDVYEDDFVCNCEYPDIENYLNFSDHKQYTRCKKCGGEL